MSKLTQIVRSISVSIRNGNEHIALEKINIFKSSSVVIENLSTSRYDVPLISLEDDSDRYIHEQTEHPYSITLSVDPPNRLCGAPKKLHIFNSALSRILFLLLLLYLSREISMRFKYSISSATCNICSRWPKLCHKGAAHCYLPE